MKISEKLGVKKLNTKELVLMSLFVAMNIVLVRVLSFQTLTQRISFGFIANALAGMILGPFWAGIMAFVSDLLGMILFSRGMSYFPPYGISAFLYGFTYGLFLYRRNPTFLKILICVIIQAVVIAMFLSTLWVYLYCMLFTETTKGFAVLFAARIIPALVNIPIHSVIVYLTAKYIPKRYLPKYIPKSVD